MPHPCLKGGTRQPRTGMEPSALRRVGSVGRVSGVWSVGAFSRVCSEFLPSVLVACGDEASQVGRRARRAAVRLIGAAAHRVQLLPVRSPRHAAAAAARRHPVVRRAVDAAVGAGERHRARRPLAARRGAQDVVVHGGARGHELVEHAEGAHVGGGSAVPHHQVRDVDLGVRVLALEGAAAGADAEDMAHLVREHADGLLIDAPAGAERVALGDLQREAFDAAAAAAAHAVQRRVRVAVGRSVGGTHAEPHDAAAHARGIGHAARRKRGARVGGVAGAVLGVAVVGRALLGEAREGLDARRLDADAELSLEEVAHAVEHHQRRGLERCVPLRGVGAPLLLVVGDP
mmetsp:Transcript_24134/g.56017  ORF Transcript_24134/g.56017 Transcript_24134/m.56017 type:complete len:345 (+) Transcript_24134:99-1133(+)